MDRLAEVLRRNSGYTSCNGARSGAQCNFRVSNSALSWRALSPTECLQDVETSAPYLTTSSRDGNDIQLVIKMYNMERRGKAIWNLFPK